MGEKKAISIKIRKFFALGALVFAASLLKAETTRADSRGDFLTICDDVADPATLDPHRQYTEKNRAIVQQVFEELFRIGPDGKFDPVLAESWKRIDPLTVRFLLRPNVTFHNGEPFDSAAVMFSLKRCLDPKTGFPGLPFITSIASATVVDPLTIDIHTYYPDGLLLHRLGISLFVVPPRYVTENGEHSLEESPIGTGPFQFSKWEKGKFLRLAKNNKYWNRNFPKVAGLEYKFLVPERQLEEFFKGKVDFFTEMPGTMTLNAKENTLTDLIKVDSLYTVVGHFNTRRGPLSNVLVRRALNLAINRSELIRYDLLGNGRIIASLTMPGEIGHNDTLVPYEFDVAKSLELMREAGYKNGFELKASARAQGIRTAKIIAKQLERIGVKLTIVAVSSDAEIITSLAEGKFDIGVAALPDPMAHSYFIQSLVLYSKSPFSMHSDQAYDDKLEEMVGELDLNRQDLLGQRLDKYIYDEALCLFTYQRIRTYGVSRRLKFQPSITGSNYFYSAEFKK
jgi:peptide/nickel transport system substrate-binding protein